MTSTQFNQAADNTAEEIQKHFDAVGIAFNNKDLSDLCLSMEGLEDKLQSTRHQITTKNLKMLIDVNAFSVIGELALKGYVLDQEALTYKPYENTESVHCWQIAQSLATPRPGRDAAFFDSMADYQSFQTAATATELETRSGQTTKRLPILWDALRAGRLGHVMDLHEREGRRFPIEFLNCGRTKRRISPVQVAAFVKEPGLMDRLMKPQNWVNQVDEFEKFIELHNKKSPAMAELLRQIRFLSVRSCLQPLKLPHRPA